MANTFTPIISGIFDGELVWNMTNFVVPDTIKKYIDSVSISHRNKFSLKKTGFETIKYKINPSSGSEILVDINIGFTGDMPRPFCQQLTQLAQGVNGAGMEMQFRDDWISNYLYTCRWTNAGDFVSSNEIQYGATMNLESWYFTSL